MSGRVRAGMAPPARAQYKYRPTHPRILPLPCCQGKPHASPPWPVHACVQEWLAHWPQLAHLCRDHACARAWLEHCPRPHCAMEQCGASRPPQSWHHRTKAVGPMAFMAWSTERDAHVGAMPRRTPRSRQVSRKWPQHLARVQPVAHRGAGPRRVRIGRAVWGKYRRLRP